MLPSRVLHRLTEGGRSARATSRIMGCNAILRPGSRDMRPISVRSATVFRLGSSSHPANLLSETPVRGARVRFRSTSWTFPESLYRANRMWMWP